MSGVYFPSPTASWGPHSPLAPGYQSPQRPGERAFPLPLNPASVSYATQWPSPFATPSASPTSQSPPVTFVPVSPQYFPSAPSLPRASSMGELHASSFSSPPQLRRAQSANWSTPFSSVNPNFPTSPFEMQPPQLHNARVSPMPQVNTSNDAHQLTGDRRHQHGAGDHTKQQAFGWHPQQTQSEVHHPSPQPSALSLSFVAELQAQLPHLEGHSGRGAHGKQHVASAHSNRSSLSAPVSPRDTRSSRRSSGMATNLTPRQLASHASRQEEDSPAPWGNWKFTAANQSIPRTLSTDSALQDLEDLEAMNEQEQIAAVNERTHRLSQDGRRHSQQQYFKMEAAQKVKEKILQKAEEDFNDWKELQRKQSELDEMIMRSMSQDASALSEVEAKKAAPAPAPSLPPVSLLLSSNRSL